jgi:hypothetical protein
VVSFSFRRFPPPPGDRDPGNHWIRSRVDPRASLDPSVVLPVASHRLCYSGSIIMKYHRKLYLHFSFCGSKFLPPNLLMQDLLCGLVIRVPGHRSRGPGFGSLRYQIFREVACVERGPFSLVSTIEKLLGRNGSVSSLEIREYGRGDPLRYHVTTFIRKSWHLLRR